MLTQQQLEDLGFTLNSNNKSPFDGQFNDFHQVVDNGHVISGHDITEVFLTKEGLHIEIELKHHSSYDYSPKHIVFKGRCTTVEFFTQVLDAVLRG